MRPAPICSEISPLHCAAVEMTAGRLVAGGWWRRSARGPWSPALPLSSGVGQPTIGRPFYVQAKGQLRLTWRPSAGSPHSEGSRFMPIMSHLLINTGRRVSWWLVPLDTSYRLQDTNPYAYPSPPVSSLPAG